MKALTLHQPWASLVAFGVKRIETRSWSTSYRGPLAIHAAARAPRDGEAPGRIIVDALGDLVYLLPEPWTEEEQVAAGLPPDGDLIGFPVPLGAVVATATLVDVLPMVPRVAPSTGPPPLDGVHRLFVDVDRLYRTNPQGGPPVDVTDQLPYGDFAEGRYGWILDDVVAFKEPIPARGRQRLWEWTR